MIGDFCALQPRGSQASHLGCDPVIAAGCIPALFRILDIWATVPSIFNSACVALWSLSSHGGPTARSAILAQPGCAELLLAASHTVRDARVNWPYAVLQSLHLVGGIESSTEEGSRVEASSFGTPPAGTAIGQEKHAPVCGLDAVGRDMTY